MFKEEKCSFDNLEGILSNEADEYFPSFEPQIGQMN